MNQTASEDQRSIRSKARSLIIQKPTNATKSVVAGENKVPETVSNPENNQQTGSKQKFGALIGLFTPQLQQNDLQSNASKTMKAEQVSYSKLLTSNASRLLNNKLSPSQSTPSEPEQPLVLQLVRTFLLNSL